MKHSQNSDRVTNLMMSVSGLLPKNGDSRRLFGARTVSTLNIHTTQKEDLVTILFTASATTCKPLLIGSALTERRRTVIMMRLIDADVLLKTLDCVWDCNDMVFEPNDCICDPLDDCKGCKWRETLDFAKRQVKNSRTVDAVSVVRCKDCKYWRESGKDMMCEAVCDDPYEAWFSGANDYCSLGERKDGEQE